MDEYRLDNLRSAYVALEEAVSALLRTQSQEEAQIRGRRNDCLALLHSAQQHRDIFPTDEFQRLSHNIHDMVNDLEKAGQTDPERHKRHPIDVVQLGASTSRGGRRSIVIEDNFLREAIQLKGPTQIARVLGCSPRTVRRRLLDLNLVAPGAPVFQSLALPDGSEERRRNVACGRSTRHTDISDQHLDSLTFAIFQLFPNAGRSMVMGQLASQGVRVSRSRLRSSMVRVRGAPPSFGRRKISRKKYWVPAVNSLWHHDGQHGLIRWKLVTHAFIDGKSRFVTGLRVHNNNRSYTVLCLFLEATALYGVPSRVRGDHGVENVQVAEAMERLRGPGRGSYIFGRSIHNTRIERLWLDWTQGLGVKWYDFFMSLEQYYGLHVDDDLHIWLLHHLFLPALNNEAQAWVNTWNFHVLQIRGEPNRSPADIFLFGQVEEGVHTLPFADESLEDQPLEDLPHYGVDHEAQRDARIREHVFNHNNEERSESLPARLNSVVCESPLCPLLPVQLSSLDARLHGAGLDACNVPSMDMRKLIWQEALRIVMELVS